MDPFYLTAGRPSRIPFRCSLNVLVNLVWLGMAMTSRSWYLSSWRRHRGCSADVLFLSISTSNPDRIGGARSYTCQISNVAVTSNQSSFTSYIIHVRDVRWRTESKSSWYVRSRDLFRDGWPNLMSKTQPKIALNLSIRILSLCHICITSLLTIMQSGSTEFLTKTNVLWKS